MVVAAVAAVAAVLHLPHPSPPASFLSLVNLFSPILTTSPLCTFSIPPLPPLLLLLLLHLLPPFLLLVKLAVGQLARLGPPVRFTFKVLLPAPAARFPPFNPSPLVAPLPSQSLPPLLSLLVVVVVD